MWGHDCMGHNYIGRSHKKTRGAPWDETSLEGAPPADAILHLHYFFFTVILRPIATNRRHWSSIYQLPFWAAALPKLPREKKVVRGGITVRQDVRRSRIYKYTRGVLIELGAFVEVWPRSVGQDEPRCGRQLQRRAPI